MKLVIKAIKCFFCQNGSLLINHKAIVRKTKKGVIKNAPFPNETMRPAFRSAKIQLNNMTLFQFGTIYLEIFNVKKIKYCNKA